MKTSIKLGMLVLFVSVLTAASAQDQDTTFAKKVKRDVKSAGKAVGHGAKKVGNKTAEIASKGKSGVVDKIYDGKKGPQGQKIYINDKSEYYWVDKKGRHHAITEAELSDDSGK